LKQEKREFEKEKKKAKKEKKEKDKDKEKDQEKSKKEKKKERKEKKKEKKEKQKEKKPDEPTLFTPVLKIKPPAPPTEVSPDSTPVATPQTTPKLVIKNLPKEKDKDKETESVPMLGFQPLRTGPARTPKAGGSSTTATPSTTPSKPGEKRKSSRPPAGGPASKSGGPAPKTSTPAPGPPPKEKKTREGRGRPPKSKEIIDSSMDSGDEPTPGIITETVGSYTDEAGNKVWICPACGKQDDGSPMIGCDQCDDWYHWLCVGINSEPSENQDWFCTRCMAKKQGLYLDKTATFHPKQRRK